MRKLLSLSILVLSVILAGCGGGSRHTETPVTPAALTLTAPATLPSAGMGVAYSQTLTATGGTAPYTWSVATGSTLPAGLVLNVATGALTGTLTTAGTFSFSITVHDSSTPALSATAAYTLSVSVAPVVISSVSLPAVTQGVAYSQTLAATGGTPPYTWTLTTGSTLPDGLSFSTAGVLSGTPTTAGAYSFSVTVADSGTPSLSATQALGLTVTAPIAPLAITTTALPPANVNFAYSATLAATGGVAPYTWALSGDGVQGLTLNTSTGVYSGTPIYSGPATLQLQVTDAVASTASVALPLSVSADGMLKGQYFFQTNSLLTTTGTGVSANAYAEVTAGSIQLDGQGSVTGGSVDLADDDGQVVHSSGVTGSYFLEAIGAGQNNVIGEFLLQLPGAPSTGSGGPDYGFVITAARRQQPSGGYDTVGTMVQGNFFKDSSTISTSPVGSGTLRLEDPNAFSGFLANTSVVFGWKGDTCEVCGASTQALDLAAAGLLSFDVSKNLTSTSTADIATGAATDNAVALSGSLAQDTTVATGNTGTNFNLYGRSTLALTGTGYTNGSLPSAMVIYVIDAQHAYALTGASGSAALLSGFLQTQAASPSLSGSFVTWGTSQDASNSAASDTAFSKADAAITLYTAASGTLTGAADVDVAGAISTLSTAANFTVGSHGRVTVTPTDSNPAPVFWLTGANTGFGITEPTGSNGAPASLLTLEPMTLSSATAGSINGAYTGGTAASASYNSYSSVSLIQSDGISAWTGFDFVAFFNAQNDDFGAELTGTFTVQPDGRGILDLTGTENATTTLFTSSSPFYVLGANRLLVLDESQAAAPVITAYQQ